MNFEILNDENALILETLISGVRKHNESTLGYEKKKSLSAFFKVVVTGCLLIKQPLFLDLGERHQLVCSS